MLFINSINVYLRLTLILDNVKKTPFPKFCSSHSSSDHDETMMIITGPDIYMFFPMGQALFSHQPYETIHIIIFKKQTKKKIRYFNEKQYVLKCCKSLAALGIQ